MDENDGYLSPGEEGEDLPMNTKRMKTNYFIDLISPCMSDLKFDNRKEENYEEEMNEVEVGDKKEYNSSTLTLTLQT